MNEHKNPQIGLAIHGLKQTVRFTKLVIAGEATLEQKYQLGFNYGLASTILNLPEFKDYDTLLKVAITEYAKYTDVLIVEVAYKTPTDPRAKTALEFVLKNYTSDRYFEVGCSWGVAAALFQGNGRLGFWLPMQILAQQPDSSDKFAALCTARLDDIKLLK